MNKKYYYDILVSAWVNVELMGESTRLVCVQLQERDFEKKIFIKSYGDFQQLLKGCYLYVECFSHLSLDSEVYTKSATAADFVYISESNEL